MSDMIETPHKGIQGEVGRVWRLEFAKRDLPFPVLLVKDEGNLLIRNDISIIWKDDIDFFHARRFEQ